MNGFGFAQIIRPRSGPSIPELLCTTTPGRLSPESRAVALLREAGVAFTTEVLVGHIAQAIAHRADELGCAGIVMGTRGKTAIGNLILGSVAHPVVHFANVPVTLIK